MKTKSYRLMFVCITVFFAILAGFPLVREAQATPPQSVDLSYDTASQTLTVTITHASWSKSFHYIQYVNIKKNGADAGKNTYDSQPDSKTFTYTYKVPASAGDTLEVTAICNLYGEKTSTLTVPKK